jgi:hypothetical protein
MITDTQRINKNSYIIIQKTYSISIYNNIAIGIIYKVSFIHFHYLYILKVLANFLHLPLHLRTIRFNDQLRYWC